MSEDNSLAFLVPLVQPVDCQPGDPRVCRPFFAEANMKLTVFYAIVQPTLNQYLTNETFPSLGVDAATLEATSLRNWVRDHSDLEWQNLEIQSGPPVMAARSSSDNMASILLSHGHLKGMHKHFGEQMLYVGIPDRFTVMVHTDPMAFSGLVQGMYDDAVKQGTQFSHDLYCSMDAVIVGKCALTLSLSAGIDLIEHMIANIFLLVSAADGKMDKKEFDQFLKTLTKFAGGGQGMVHQASQQLLQHDLAPVLALVNTITVQGGILYLQESAKKLRESFGEQEYAVIAQALNFLAETIAKASGSFFSRSKVSEEEALAIVLIARALT